MANYRVRLITSWLVIDGRNDMRVAVDHPAPGVGYSDVTGQPDANIPTDPNALIVEAYPVDDALLAALEADTNAVVLWGEING